jgi:hypothetical protein
VDHDGAVRLPASDRRAERGGRELGGHALFDGVADDPVGEHVLDRAAVELPLDGRVLGDVGEPHRITSPRRELALQQVVVHRRARRLAAPAAALLRGRRPHPLLAAQPMRPSLADDVAGPLQLIGDEAVTERWIIGMDIDDRVREVRVVPVAIADRLSLPLVERLRREPEHPAGQPHRDRLGGQLLDQRVGHFGSESLAK